MKLFIAAILASLSLMACSSNDHSNGSGGTGGGGTADTKDLRPVTTRAECYGSRVAQTLEGDWQSEFEGGGITMHMRFSFDGNNLTLTNICEIQGKQASAYVTVPYLDSGSTFQSLANAHDEESSDGVNCNVSISSQKIQYRFDGGCLVFTDPKAGGSFYLHSVN